MAYLLFGYKGACEIIYTITCTSLSIKLLMWSSCQTVVNFLWRTKLTS